MDFDTRLGAYAVIVRDDQVLLALWNEGERPLWTLPGGGVDVDEQPADGAIREVFEETGYRAELVRLLTVSSGLVPAERRLRPNDRPLKTVRVIYEARVVGGELTHELDGSTDEARWIPLADLPSLATVAWIAEAIALVTG